MNQKEWSLVKAHFKAKLRKMGVSIVYLFGSRANGMGSRTSDVDIGVVLREPIEDTRSSYKTLYELFSAVYPSHRLDIVFLDKTSLALQYDAIKDGKIIFEEDPKSTADYENRVVNQYLDFRPILDLFDRVTMKRYAKA
jgi:predicted nucleotidyltransferase